MEFKTSNGFLYNISPDEMWVAVRIHVISKEEFNDWLQYKIEEGKQESKETKE